jgi:type II secretory pathway pseudopilin PulG
MTILTGFVIGILFALFCLSARKTLRLAAQLKEAELDVWRLKQQLQALLGGQQDPMPPAPRKPSKKNKRGAL